MPDTLLRLEYPSGHVEGAEVADIEPTRALSIVALVATFQGNKCEVAFSDLTVWGLSPD